MGVAVLTLVEDAADAFFSRNAAEAQAAIAADDVVDRIDIEIERSAVDLLTRAALASVQVHPELIRHLLAIVKINNEVERIADAGVDIAELTVRAAEAGSEVPATARVMTNSVVGLVRDATRAAATLDVALARVVLASEHVVGNFKSEVVRKAQRQIASGTMNVDAGFDLLELTGQCMFIADHCTNIAEQVLYVRTGMIVRHGEHQWVERPAEQEGA